MKTKKQKIQKKLSLATWKLRKALIHLLGGRTLDESSKSSVASYERGKLIGQAEAAAYIKGYMKDLWKDPRWSEKAYKRVSGFLNNDLYEEYRKTTKK